MATTEAHLADGSVFEIERQGQWIYSDLPQPDPRWRSTDSNGHEHFYAEGNDHYPTLKLVFGEPYWCDSCQDEHQDTWYECRQCREKVQPRTRIKHGPQWLAGPTLYSLDGEPIGEERGNQIMAELQRRADEATRITSRPAIGCRVRFGDSTVTVVPTDVDAADNEVTVMADVTGAMETVPLEQLRAIR